MIIRLRELFSKRLSLVGSRTNFLMRGVITQADDVAFWAESLRVLSRQPMRVGHSRLPCPRQTYVPERRDARI